MRQVEAVTSVGPIGMRLEAVPDRQRRLTAERAVDSVLADSFPASDPPSWTASLARTNPGRRAVSDVSIVRSRGRPWVDNVASIAGSIGIVLLTPLFIVGLPIALAWRVVLDLRGWPSPTRSGEAKS